MGSGRAKNEKGALVGYVSSAPVATENATSRGAEAQCKSDESTECEPISIAVLWNIAVVAISLSCNPEQNHIDNPSDERRHHTESGEEGHDDRADTKTEYDGNEAKEKGETCHSCGCSTEIKGKCMGYAGIGTRRTESMQDECLGQVMYDRGIQMAITVSIDETVSLEGLRKGVGEAVKTTYVKWYPTLGPSPGVEPKMPYLSSWPLPTVKKETCDHVGTPMDTYRCSR